MCLLNADGGSAGLPLCSRPQERLVRLERAALLPPPPRPPPLPPTESLSIPVSSPAPLLGIIGVRIISARTSGDEKFNLRLRNRLNKRQLLL